MINKYTDSQRKQIIDLYLSGLSIRNVASKTECNENFVRKTLHQNSIQMRDKAYYSKFFDNETYMSVKKAQ